MATAWNGGDPIAVVDGEDYELGTAYQAQADITITHARIFTPAGETTPATRHARYWSNVGGLLYNEDLAASLPDGWSLHELTTPLEVVAGTVFIASYNTGGNYGALAGALDADVPSADGLVTALAAANAPGGNNGRFNETPGSFPNLGTGAHNFYGLDFQYVAGIGGNTAPRITDTSTVVNGLQVTASALVEDDESLTGLTLRVDWGDGNVSDAAYPTLSASHTYATGGVYPLLFRATDSDGATDYAADYVITVAPDATLFTLDIRDLQAALLTAAGRAGGFDTVAGHEPREAPGKGPHCAFWLLRIKPTGRLVSGLGSIGTVISWIARIYIPAGIGADMPYDDVDQELYRLTDRLMAWIFSNFTLGGRVREVDILGHSSPGVSADPGYQDIAGTKFRVMTITLPLIVNDLYEEVP